MVCPLCRSWVSDTVFLCSAFFYSWHDGHLQWEAISSSRIFIISLPLSFPVHVPDSSDPSWVKGGLVYSVSACMHGCLHLRSHYSHGSWTESRDQYIPQCENTGAGREVEGGFTVQISEEYASMWPCCMCSCLPYTVHSCTKCLFFLVIFGAESL